MVFGKINAKEPWDALPLESWIFPKGQRGMGKRACGKGFPGAGVLSLGLQGFVSVDMFLTVDGVGLCRRRVSGSNAGLGLVWPSACGMGCYPHGSVELLVGSTLRREISLAAGAQRFRRSDLLQLGPNCCRLLNQRKIRWDRTRQDMYGWLKL